MRRTKLKAEGFKGVFKGANLQGSSSALLFIYFWINMFLSKVWYWSSWSRPWYLLSCLPQILLPLDSSHTPTDYPSSLTCNSLPSQPQMLTVS